MEYRSLGRTGTQVSNLCLGCMLFGWGSEEDDAIRIAHRAMDAGINFFDTSNNYGEGRSETILGKALKQDGRRERVVLATKAHGRVGDGPNDWGNHRYHLMQQVENSLRRLQTDHIDLYQMHRPMGGIPIDETLRALDDLVRQGKVRYIGTSTFAAWQLMEATWASRALGLNRFISEQPPYHILDRRVERELLPFARTYGVGIIPWSPLAGGLLSGKYRREGAPEDSRYASGKFRSGESIPEALWPVLEGLQSLVERKGCTMSQFALAWCAAMPGVTSPIIGPRTMEQLEDNLKAVTVQISEEDKKAVDEIVKPGTHVVSYYDADFGPNARWS
jgi:aryl-alcohol dehydrogenase-like predicted oxidoreductase